MAERTFYLCTRKVNNYFYALDRQNYLNKWNVENGQLMQREITTLGDFKDYTVDIEVYDKNWFHYSVISKIDDIQSDKRRVHVLEITKEGKLEVKVQFLHPAAPKHIEQHFYFNSTFTQMIELLITPAVNKADLSKGVYNEFKREEIALTLGSRQQPQANWVFVQVLNKENSNFPEWHHKTLYPYPLNMTDMSVAVVLAQQPKEIVDGV